VILPQHGSYEDMQEELAMYERTLRRLRAASPAGAAATEVYRRTLEAAVERLRGKIKRTA